jgi:hypothetical protein
MLVHLLLCAIRVILKCERHLQQNGDVTLLAYTTQERSYNVAAVITCNT